MKKIFSFLTAILFAGSMMAADPVTVKSTFTKATVPANDAVTDLEGVVTWSIATEVGAGTPSYTTGKNSQIECLKFGAKAAEYFSKVTLSTDYYEDYNVKSVTLYVLNNGKKTGTLTVKQGETTIGTASEEFGTAWTALTATGVTGNGGTLEVSYEVAQASYWSYIEVQYETSQGGEGGETISTVKTVYCKAAQAWWKDGSAAVGVYAFVDDDVKNAAWPGVRMTPVEGETDLWKADIDTAMYAKIIFTRMNPSDEGNQDWGAKTADLEIPADKNLYTITSTTAVWGDPGVTGEWSVYGEGGDTPEPPTPVEAAYYLVGTMNSWQPAEAYKFAPAEAEGEYLLHTTLAEKDEIKVIKVEGETTTWYPAVGDNYIVDAQHAGEKDIYFRPAGNEAWAEFGGYIWMGENQPAPVADFTQPFTLKFNGTGTSGSDASGAFAADVAAIFDAASAPYVASVETATKIYAGRPIADDNSSVKFGTTSAQGAFAFTLAQTIEVDSIIVNATQYGNNAAKVTVNGTEFDLTAGNKKPQDCKITPEDAVSAITIAQSGSERIYLRNVRVYPKTQGGDTPEEIVLPVVKLAGSLTSWSEPALMVNAEDSLSASVTLNLGINDYQLKVVSDDNWLSKAGDGELYTMHRDWNHVDHLDLINTGDNIQLTTDVEGAYTFTWTYADSSLVVTFPAAPAQPKFYITGDEDIVGEGNPTWGKNGALESFSDTLVMNLAAGFHKFKLITPAEQWLGMEALTDTAYGLFTDDDTNICFNLAEAGEVTVIYNATEFKVEGDFYIAPVANYYLIGDSAFVVDAGATADKAWTPDAIPSFQDTTVLKLKAGVNYIMRLSLEGTWENHRDFRHLTDTAAGLIELPDEYGNHSIGFSLAEAGEVQVVYIAAEGENPEIFKLIGDFYVEPTPEPAKFYVTGDSALVTDAGFAGKAWNPAAIKAEADTLVLNLKAEQYYNLKVTLDGTWNTAKGFNDLTEKPAGVTMGNDENIIFSLAEEGAVQVIYIAGETPIFKIAGNFYVEPTPPTVENGFYLVGSMNDWTASAEYKFAVNSGNENEYVLQVTLDVNDELKVKKVEAGQPDIWYPGEGGNYVVDANHAGATTMYFQVDYKEEWAAFGGYFYIVPTSTVGFENTAADAKAVKVLKNGILVIEKNNKTYNVMGQMVK